MIQPYIDKDKKHNLGRYNVTKQESDKYLAKVPTLRNIELTAPYLYNGDAKTLHAVVGFMMKYQVGFIPNDENIEKVVKFLKTLTGELPKIVKNNKTGYIFESNNMNSLSDKILKILLNFELAKKMSENALKEVLKYSIQKHYRDLMNVYEYLVYNKVKR